VRDNGQPPRVLCRVPETQRCFAKCVGKLMLALAQYLFAHHALTKGSAAPLTASLFIGASDRFEECVAALREAETSERPLPAGDFKCVAASLSLPSGIGSRTSRQCFVLGCAVSLRLAVPHRSPGGSAASRLHERLLQMHIRVSHGLGSMHARLCWAGKHAAIVLCVQNLHGVCSAVASAVRPAGSFPECCGVGVSFRQAEQPSTQEPACIC
jgi:hypothetical protein